MCDSLAGAAAAVAKSALLFARSPIRMIHMQSAREAAASKRQDERGERQRRRKRERIGRKIKFGVRASE